MARISHADMGLELAPPDKRCPSFTAYGYLYLLIVPEQDGRPSYSALTTLEVSFIRAPFEFTPLLPI